MSMHSIQGLYAIIDTLDRTDISPAELALRYLKGGARLLQLRQKKASQSEKKKFGREILSYKKKYQFTFIINDDAELARELEADGVHLGQNDMSVDHARKIFGNEKIIGKSTHSWEEAKETLREPVDYIACGAIFPTSSKPQDHPVIGLQLLKKIVLTSPVPVVAIGGINRQNFQQVLQTGVHSIALLSALSKAKDIKKETAFFLNLFQEQRK